MALRNVKLSFSKDINNPTELSDRELNTLVALVGDPTINLELSGYIRKNSIYKSQYKALTAYPGLAGDRQVQYDMLVDDIYEIYPAKTQINEGEDTKFTVTGTVPASALKYTLSHNIAISYAPAEATELQLKNIIQERIKVVNGKLVCEAAQENASWTDVVTITTVPMGMEDEPNAVKTCQVVVQAIAVTDLKISGIDDVDSGATLVLNMNLVPANNTKTFNPNSIVWSTNGGTINQTGMLTAPNTQGRYQVTVGLTLYSTGTFRDFIEHSESFVVTGALFSAEQNPVVFEAMKQAYPEFADKTAISTKDVKDITDIAPLFAKLKALNVPFSFDEFAYFTKVSKLPNVTSNNTFYGNTNITSIALPESVKTIPINAAGGYFAECTSLTRIDFGGVVELSGGNGSNDRISNGVCGGCIALSEVIAEYAEKITGGTSTQWAGTSHNQGAFSGCTALTNIDLPKCKIIGYELSGSFGSGRWGSFRECSSLTSINAPILEEIIGNRLDGSPFAGTALQQFSFPPTLKSLNYAAFSCWSNISVIDLSNTQVNTFTTKLDTNSRIGLFSYCTSLTKVIFPHKEISLISIGDDKSQNGWLYNCTALVTLDFSGSTITSIPAYWYHNSSTSLRHVYFPIDNVIPYGTNALMQSVDGNGVGSKPLPYVFVNDSIVDTLKAASGWSDYVEAGGQILPVSTMASYGWTA